MKLKVYGDRMSQPSRAIILFCKVNKIQFDEILINLAKRHQFSPDFKEINPLGKVPAIVDGKLKLFERLQNNSCFSFFYYYYLTNLSIPIILVDYSHAILIYLASSFPSVADHWYPNDLSKRAKIHSVLDWHHTNLRPGAAGYVLNSVLAPFLGLPLNSKAASEAEKVLTKSLLVLETFWLKGNGKFLVGSNQPSIADLSLVCELMQLQLLEEKDRVRLLSPHKKVEEWIENTKKATMPHFEMVHKTLFGAKEKFEKQREMRIKFLCESNCHTVQCSETFLSTKSKRRRRRRRKKMKLKVYGDRMSQPSRAIILFCKVNKIQFDEILINLAKRHQFSPDFKEINPLGKVPAIVDGKLKLFERLQNNSCFSFFYYYYLTNLSIPIILVDYSHAILIYLASSFPSVADHWYPNDLSKRAKIHSVLDWHHTNLRPGAAGYVLNSVLAPFLGLPLNSKAASEAEKVLTKSLLVLETFWLKGNGKFLVGSNQPSIADLSLVCELMQLQLLEEKDRVRLLSPHKKVEEWIENTKKATMPHFEMVHKTLFGAKEKFEKQREMGIVSKM
ncbi:unnamed protein product [Cochlearia groenlandica]